MTRFGPVAQDLFGKERIAFTLLVECGVESGVGRALQLDSGQSPNRLEVQWPKR